MLNARVLYKSGQRRCTNAFDEGLHTGSNVRGGNRIDMPKIELYRDNFQNYKRYGIPKAQLVIADIPYNIAF